jgi:hypothetical protein
LRQVCGEERRKLAKVAKQFGKRPFALALWRMQLRRIDLRDLGEQRAVKFGVARPHAFRCRIGFGWLDHCYSPFKIARTVVNSPYRRLAPIKFVMLSVRAITLRAQGTLIPAPHSNNQATCD